MLPPGVVLDVCLGERETGAHDKVWNAQETIWIVSCWDDRCEIPNLLDRLSYNLAACGGLIDGLERKNSIVHPRDNDIISIHLMQIQYYTMSPNLLCTYPPHPQH